jgi:hypothetical protein
MKERDPGSETLCFLVFKILDDGPSPEKLVVLRVKLHCQNPLNSIHIPYPSNLVASHNVIVINIAATIVSVYKL